MRTLSQIMQSQLDERFFMTDNEAVLQGFNTEVYGEYAANALHLLVKPETDLSQRFKAWDMDCQCFIAVNGWLAEFNVC